MAIFGHFLGFFGDIKNDLKMVIFVKFLQKNGLKNG